MICVRYFSIAYIVIAIILSVIIGCSRPGLKDKNAQPDLFDQWYGREINLTTLSGSEAKSAKFTIVNYINANCLSCVQKITRWNEFLSMVPDNAEVQFKCYIFSHDYDLVQDVLNEYKFRRKVIFDSNNEFIKLNGLPDDERFYTLLLDKENKIKIIGSPFTNPQMQMLYLSILNGK